jgi:hypothetical protein
MVARAEETFRLTAYQVIQAGWLMLSNGYISSPGSQWKSNIVKDRKIK